MITLHQLLKAAVKQNATDLHVVAGSPPVMRVSGQVMRVKVDELNSDMTQKLCYSILTDAQKSRFEAQKELDFSFGIADVSRFRANLFYQRGFVSGVFRRIPAVVPSIEELGLPKVIGEMVNFDSGLVLVTGPTGSGKTTTLASMIDKFNREQRGHIITLEDPIEFIHVHQNCIVNQREVGIDTNSYKLALKQVLRQDPDVCLLGELRDLETIEAAMTLAETGHLVFATLHTNNAIQTISRLVGVFPSDQQDRVRAQLSFVLRAVVSQRLVQSLKGDLVVANEILIMNPNICNLVRENKMHQVYGMMQVGQDQTGMRTLNQSLLKLVLKRKIDLANAFASSSDPDELDRLLKQKGV